MRRVRTWGGAVLAASLLGVTAAVTAAAATPITVTRVSGGSRDETAIAASMELFPSGGATAVVLASDANFPDALAGAPLASGKGGPLLLVPPTGLTAEISREITRVAPAGTSVFILGGTAAIPSSVETTLSGMGDKPTRLAGTDRFGTAVAIAGALGNPGTVFEATGLGFPDGLSAGAAAAATHGVVLLTDGSAQAPETASYLSAHAGAHYAIGGPAATADQTATAVAGADRYTTAAMVASKFFAAGPAIAGFASGAAFPDALSGGASIGARGGPLLLVPPSGALPSSLNTYLTNTTSIVTALLYGGVSAVGADVQTELAAGGSSGTGTGGSGQPSGLGFTTALGQWQTGATANAANQHQYWLNAGNYLSADEKTDTNTSGYPAAIAELYQIAGYPPAAMLTAQQATQENSDIAALNTFFGTPTLVVHVT